MTERRHDLVVIGAGPGGYVAAIRARQLGLDTACVEEEKALGGTCLRIGCIPSKALLESSELYREARESLGVHGIRVGEVSLDLPAMQKRKQATVDGLVKGVDLLFAKNKVTRYHGHARLDGPGRVTVEQGSERTTIAAGNVLIATGSRPAMLPGVTLDGDRIGTSTEALAYTSVPGHLVVIGAGAIGLELGSVWRRLGARVTVLEYLDRILPGMDREIATEAKRIFEKQGLSFHLGARVTRARVIAPAGTGAPRTSSTTAGRAAASAAAGAGAGGGDGRVVVEAEGMDPIDCDRLLVAVGRVPHTDGLGLESVGIETDRRGNIPVDAHFRTSAPNVYAIGDVIPGPMLAHKAEDEAMACVEIIATGYGHVNYDAIPNIVYTMPEVASVGRNEDTLKEAGVPYRKGTFPFLANGRARALAHTEGRVKILAHAETDRVLGVHILGPRAGDLIAEAAVAIEFGASAEDIARSSHAHPTLAEAMREAALAVDKRAIHI